MNEPEPPFRNVWISLVACLVVAQVSIVLFRPDPDSRGALLFACFMLALVLHGILDELWLRKQRRGGRS